MRAAVDAKFMGMLRTASFINLFGPELLIIFALTAFWIWMIIDCATKETDRKDRMIWLLVIILVPLGCVIYLFARKLARSKEGTA